MAAKTFEPPEFWSFKPFFTLQPVADTREKQLRLWKELILQYCVHNSQYKLIPANFPHFRNDSIDRELNSEGRQAVINYLIKAGNAEWEDADRTSLLIIWKSVEAVAGEIYNWATSNNMVGDILTIYELHSGEDYQDSGFYGIDPLLLRKALEVLERNKKCVVIAGSIPEEDGVKFLSVK